MYTVYVLALEKIDGHYVGMSKQFEKRLARHRSGSGAMATKKYGVKSVVHTEEREKFGMARHRERELTLFWKKYGTCWGGGWTATT